MNKYYITSKSWDQQSIQYVIDMDGIKRTVKNTDWYESIGDAIDDCEFLGEFNCLEEAEAEYSK